MINPQSQDGFGKRIAMVLPDIAHYRSRFVMIEELSKLSNELLLLTNEPPPNTSRSGSGNLRIQSPASKTNKVVFDAYALGKLMESSFRFDILHDMFYNLIPSFLIARSLRKRPVLILSIYASNIDWYLMKYSKHYENPSYARLRRLNFFLERIDLLLADGILVVSPHQKESLIKYLSMDPKLIRVIPSEVDTDFFHPIRNAQTEHINHHDNPRILFVGNIFKLKGVFELIESFALVRREFPEAELWMVGNTNPFDIGELNQSIIKKDLKNSIKFWGFVSQTELVKLYSQATLLALPTRFEGSPRAIKEACACGCPVIASDHPGIRSIDPDGSCITFINESNPESIADGIMKVIAMGESRERISQIARQLMVKNFSPSKIAYQIMDFYQYLRSSR